MPGAGLSGQKVQGMTDREMPRVGPRDGRRLGAVESQETGLWEGRKIPGEDNIVGVANQRAWLSQEEGALVTGLGWRVGG